MGHQETYRHNEAYAQFLAGWDAAFYAKYADTLKPDQPDARALDVGCGVGQVVARLKDAGFDVSDTPRIMPYSSVAGRPRRFLISA